jgi:hypothetical protein
MADLYRKKVTTLAQAWSVQKPARKPPGRFEG